MSPLEKSRQTQSRALRNAFRKVESGPLDEPVPEVSLRLGFMLRNFKELGGIAVYTRELLEHLLEIDRKNEYYIFYGSKDLLGRYAHHPNVQETYVPCRSKFLWDQAHVASVAERLGVEVMFSPKMSSPLLFRGRKVFAIHGAEQFVHAKEYPLLDRLYVRTFLPWFARTSDRVIALSESAKVDLVHHLGVEPDRIAVTYPGTKEIYFREVAPEDVERVRVKYNLPQHYLLHVGLVWGAKNFEVFPKVLELLEQNRSIILAHAGAMRGWVRESSESHNRIVELGFVPDEDLAALYRGAVALVFPSLYEGFGIPLLEAMCCGCPVITTNWGAMKEVVNGAALLVDSRDPNAIANAVESLLDSPELRADLVRRGKERARDFSWNRTARETLAILEGAKEAVRLPAEVTEEAGAMTTFPDVAPAGAPPASVAPTRASAPATPSPSHGPTRAAPARLPGPTTTTEDPLAAREKRKSAILRVVKIAISVLLLGYLAKQVNFGAMIDALRQARWDLVLLAYAVSHVDRIIQGGKWWGLVRSSGMRIPFWGAIANTYAGNFAGQFLPAGVGGDVVRLVLLKRLQFPAIEMAASIVVERLFGLFALATVASASIAVATVRGVDLPGSIEGVTLVLFAAMATTLLLSFRRGMAEWVARFSNAVTALPVRVPYSRKLGDLLTAYHKYSGRSRAVLSYFALSIVEVLVLVTINFLVARALHLDVSPLMLLLVVPVTMIAYRIPISLNGLGVQEGMLGYFFQQAGYGIDAGVSMSLVLRVVEIATYLPGALFLWNAKREEERGG